jgi:hypothetical protein
MCKIFEKNETFPPLNRITYCKENNISMRGESNRTVWYSNPTSVFIFPNNSCGMHGLIFIFRRCN